MRFRHEVKIWGIFWALSLCIYPSASGLSAEAAGPDDARIPVSALKSLAAATPPEVRKALRSLDEAADNGDKAGVQAAVANLGAMRLRWGSRNLPFVAGFFLHKARRLFQSGRSEGGIFLLEQASEGFPEDYGIRFALTKMYWSSEKADLKAGTVNFTKGIGLYVESKLRRDRLAFSGLLLLVLAAGLAVYVYFMVLLLKNFKKMAYDIKKKLGLDPSSTFSSIVIGLLVSLPWIMGGFYVFILAIPLFIWPYLVDLKSKVVLTGSAALILCLPAISGYATDRVVDSDSPYHRSIEEFSRHIWDTETLYYFRDRLNHDRPDPSIDAAVGLMYKWLGDARTYHRVFAGLSEQNSNHIPTLINFGNAQYLDGRLEEAEKLYEQALSIDSNSVEAHFNLSLVLHHRWEFARAKNEYQAAYALDPNRIRRFLEDQASDKTRPMDKIPDAFPRQASSSAPRIASPMQEGLMSVLFIPFPRQGSVVPYLACSSFMMAFFFWRRKAIPKVSEQCDQCGTVFDPEGKCPLCAAIKASHTHLDPTRMQRASGRKRRYAVFKEAIPTVSNAVLPGAGLLLDDAEFSGLIFVFFTVLVVIGGLVCLTISSQPFPRGLIVAFLAGYYLITNLVLFFQQRYGV